MQRSGCILIGIGFGPREQFLDHVRDRRRTHLALHRGMMRRPSMPWAVHHVNGITAPDKPVHPALAAVSRSEKIGPLPATAVDHHQRQRMAQVRRYPVFHIHLTAQGLARRQIDGLRPGPEEPMRRKLQVLGRARMKLSGPKR